MEHAQCMFDVYQIANVHL